MTSHCGENIKIEIFGESHGDEIGVIIEGLPAGKAIDMAALGEFLARRAPGKNEFSTARKEADIPEIVSGLENGITNGEVFKAVIRNTNRRSNDPNHLHFHPKSESYHAL